MSKLTQQPEKVFEVHSITNVTKYVFLSDGENIIVQTHDPELGNTLKQVSGKVQSPVKVLTDLITGVSPLQIDFESTEKKRFFSNISTNNKTDRRRRLILLLFIFVLISFLHFF